MHVLELDLLWLKYLSLKLSILSFILACNLSYKTILNRCLFEGQGYIRLLKITPIFTTAHSPWCFSIKISFIFLSQSNFTTLLNQNSHPSAPLLPLPPLWYCSRSKRGQSCDIWMTVCLVVRHNHQLSDPLNGQSELFFLPLNSLFDFFCLFPIFTLQWRHKWCANARVIIFHCRYNMNGPFSFCSNNCGKRLEHVCDSSLPLPSADSRSPWLPMGE